MSHEQRRHFSNGPMVQVSERLAAAAYDSAKHTAARRTQHRDARARRTSACSTSPLAAACSPGAPPVTPGDPGALRSHDAHRTRVRAVQLRCIADRGQCIAIQQRHCDVKLRIPRPAHAKDYLAASRYSMIAVNCGAPSVKLPERWALANARCASSSAIADLDMKRSRWRADSCWARAKSAFSSACPTMRPWKCRAKNALMSRSLASSAAGWSSSMPRLSGGRGTTSGSKPPQSVLHAARTMRVALGRCTQRYAPHREKTTVTTASISKYPSCTSNSAILLGLWVRVGACQSQAAPLAGALKDTPAACREAAPAPGTHARGCTAARSARCRRPDCWLRRAGACFPSARGGARVGRCQCRRRRSGAARTWLGSQAAAITAARSAAVAGSCGLCTPVAAAKRSIALRSVDM